jgi:hypothetical protein
MMSQQWRHVRSVETRTRSEVLKVAIDRYQESEGVQEGEQRATKLLCGDVLGSRQRCKVLGSRRSAEHSR